MRALDTALWMRVLQPLGRPPQPATEEAAARLLGRLTPAGPVSWVLACVLRVGRPLVGSSIPVGACF